MYKFFVIYAIRITRKGPSNISRKFRLRQKIEPNPNSYVTAMMMTLWQATAMAITNLNCIVNPPLIQVY